VRRAFLIVAVLAAGCRPVTWPDPPAVEATKYEADHRAWKEDQRALGGYRILTPAVVNGGEWTVVDFNFAFNPPCAYSRYTLCPLPPPENRLPVAVAAGLKRLPSAQSYSPS
jgi:hypothetical protein